MNPRLCINCHRHMIVSRYAVPGQIRHNAKGLCRACYDKGRPRSARNRQPVDWVTVDRAIAGIQQHLTSREITEAVDYLSMHGQSAQQIADRLRVTTRTVHRARARIRAQIRQEKAAA